MEDRTIIKSVGIITFGIVVLGLGLGLGYFYKEKDATRNNK